MHKAAHLFFKDAGLLVNIVGRQAACRDFDGERFADHHTRPAKYPVRAVPPFGKDCHAAVFGKYLQGFVYPRGVGVLAVDRNAARVTEEKSEALLLKTVLRS